MIRSNNSFGNILITFTFLLIVACGSKAPHSERSSSEESSNDHIKTIYVSNLSGEFTINGSVGSKLLDGKFIKLFETEGKDFFAIDSAEVNNQSFSFNVENVKTGFFRLGVNRHDTRYFIIHPEEKELSLNVNPLSFANQTQITNSRENSIYDKYMLEKKKHNQRLSAIRKSKISRTEKAKQIKEEERKLKVFEDKIAMENEASFASKIIRIYQSPNRFNKDLYWEDVDFNDVELIRSMALNDRVQDYMRSHGKAGLEGNDGFYNAVDFIYAKSSSDETVMNFMLYIMMEGFYSSGMQELSAYIIDNYIYGEACGNKELSEFIKRKASGIKSLEIGQIPPDFSIKNDKNEWVQLSKVSKDNNYTLVFFWSSWCHNCEQQIPILKRTYDSNKNKGFEIIGISVDKDKSAWLNGIKAKKCNWINVSQLEVWESPVAKDYRVNSTPMMFLINKNRELVLKTTKASQIQLYINQNL